MRAHHVIAVVAILLISFGVKVFFFPAPTAEADVNATAGMNVLQMQIDHPNRNNLPSEKVIDRSLVYSEPD